MIVWDFDSHSNDLLWTLAPYAVPPTEIASQKALGLEYCSVIGKDHITGCQFDTERSGRVGLTVLKSFVSL